MLTSLELCAGAGGQALGLERAGFEHVALVEQDRDACATLRLNRPNWRVIEKDLRKVSRRELLGEDLERIDLLAGGVPCPPFSVAGRRLGRDDERDLFPEVIRLVKATRPRALMIENVKGLLSKRFDDYRKEIKSRLELEGLVTVAWDLFEASHFGVPQRRSRSVLIALRPSIAQRFVVPSGEETSLSVGEVLVPHLGDWAGRHAWAEQARDLAPTLVGGSSKHGGADLGPTGAKRAWARLGVNGHLVAHEGPRADHSGPLTLTVEHASLLQGFPADWKFVGLKTARYRQVGNAFPPPVAEAIGLAIRMAFQPADSFRDKAQ